MAWSGQEGLYNAIVVKLRADTVANGLVALTLHDASNPEKYRIARDKPSKVNETPFLGVKIERSVPLDDDGVSMVQKARVSFRCYANAELTSIKIADRMDNLLQGVAERLVLGGNRGYLDFSDSVISNRNTEWKGHGITAFDNDLSVWTTLVEADVIWLDGSCPTP